MSNFRDIEDALKQYDRLSNTGIADKLLDKDELIVLWNINQTCNFSCDYCSLQQGVSLLSDHFSSEEIAGLFSRLHKKIFFLITGGEPFLYKDFSNLIMRLTANHVVNINSNLYHPSVYEFADKVSPANVSGIHVSIHFEERIKHKNGFQDLAEKYAYLQKKGFHVFCSYVAHPCSLGEIQTHFETLNKSGIDRITPKLFIGQYDGKTYPAAYTAGEFQMLKSMNQVTVDVDFCNPLSSYFNHDCSSGKYYFYMKPDGDISRCMSSAMKLGSIKSPEEILAPESRFCNMKNSLCQFECVLLSSAQTRRPGFWERLKF